MTEVERQALDITVTAGGGRLRVIVQGDMDLATSGRLVDEVSGQLDENVRNLVVDLSGVSFCDSSGLNCLIAIRTRCDEQGTAMTITGATPAFRQIAEITGLTEFLAVQAD